MISSFRTFLSRLSAYRRNGPLETRLDEESSAHIALLAEDYVRRGMSWNEALAKACCDFGGVEQMKERHREGRRFRWIDATLQDLRYAIRQLRHTPGFTALTVLTLAVGIGVNAAMFTVIDSTLLRRLPFADSSRVIVAESIGQVSSGVTYQDIQAWRSRAHTLQGIGFYSQFITNLDAKVSTNLLIKANVSSNLLPLLGARPLLGRLFIEADMQPGRAKQVILPESVWRDNFNADPGIVGGIVKLSGQPYTVVGVMPKTFQFPVNSTPVLWTPLTLDKKVLEEHFTLTPVARLRPGVTVQQAARELSALQRALNKEDKTQHNAPELLVESYKDSLTKGVKDALLALEAAVALVWLIACANAAGLLLTRLNSRRRELSIRNALGASRGRLIRQLLTESLLISVAACAIGIAFAELALRVLQHQISNTLNEPAAFGLSFNVLVVMLAATFASALLIGLAPALHIASSPAREGLNDSSLRTGVSGRQKNVRDFFVIAEVALSVVLLVSAGLMLRTLYAIRGVPTGFSDARVLTTALFIPTHEYETRDVVTTFYQPLLAQLKALPGITNAGLVSVFPVQPNFNVTGSFEFVGRPKPELKDQPVAALRLMSPNMTRMLGIRLLRGRLLNGSDTASSAPVAIINQTFANRYFPHADAIGQQMKISEKGPRGVCTIVGIVDDVHQSALSEPPVPEMDISLHQITPADDLYFLMTMFMQLAVKANGPSAAVAPQVRAVLHRINPDLALGDLKELQDLVDDSLGSQTLAARLLTLFAAIALLIAGAGLYALMAYSVTQRTHEIGVRVALGAGRREVYAMILRHSALVAGLGLASGIAGAWFATRALRGFLYGTAEHDWLTLGAVSTVLPSVAMLASYLPARRAASVDPVIALRHE